MKEKTAMSLRTILSNSSSTRAFSKRNSAVLGFVPVESWLRGLPGRPGGCGAGTSLQRQGGVRHLDHPRAHRAPCHRRALRRLCGWSQGAAVPRTFSRAFSDFAEAPCQRLHEALIDKTLRDHLVGHVSRVGNLGARERSAATPKRRRGRPRKGEQRPRRPEGWRASPT